MRLRFEIPYSRENSIGRGRPDTFWLGMPSARAPFVAVYETWRQFGGHEEGGWWYDAGNRIALACINPRKKGAARKLRAFAQKLTDYGISCGDVVIIHRAYEPLPYYPEYRPHFE